ncbi:MAG: class I SAM-dependent methyltransferase [Vicingaceae bacterium]
MNIQEKEQKEIDFWRDSTEEKPSVFSVPNLINKFKEADIFLEKLVAHGAMFKKSHAILELGAGQAWASCMVKFYYSDKTIKASDISPYAIESAKKWEAIFKVDLDGVFQAKSYDTGLENESQDLIFCFASAHHFIKHRSTFSEMHRIMKPGAALLYLHEPVCRNAFYTLSYRRANKKRPQVPEDVLRYRHLLKLGREAGFVSGMLFAPTIKNRSPFGTMYYWVLAKLPFLQGLLPCTADFIFIKK